MSPHVVIVTPALSDANNGNWRTAARWAGFLADSCRVRLATAWPSDEFSSDDVMIALHARRSAASIAAWHAERGSAGLGLVLTGTDLYRDIQTDTDAQRSLAQAQAIVVLQECGITALPEKFRCKARVIFQSTSPLAPLEKNKNYLRVVMVGHLRAEKSPETLFAVARLLAGRSDILMDHIGGALDPALGRQAMETQAVCPNYRWLGELSYTETRDHIRSAHLLVHCSQMEGGAHVIMEALASGTPVLASCVDGNVGMLGKGYSGYFPWNDAAALAALLIECRSNQSETPGLLRGLERQAAARAALFVPEAEREAVRALLADLSGGKAGE